MKTDVLILGSGLAGLFCAHQISKKRPDLSISILTKGGITHNNSSLAQGGIAISNPSETEIQQHINDTLIAGDHLCDRDVVSSIIHDSFSALNDLLELNVDFDSEDGKVLDRVLEGGHSAHRIVHHKDSTGSELIQKLVTKIRTYPNITLFEDHFSLRLLQDKSKSTCTGVCTYNQKSGEIFFIHSKNTVLCTGGSGDVFRYSTNHEGSTGDGLAMAIRIGARVEDMEFIQFHPTALFVQNRHTVPLISEAVRGHGAFLTDESGVRFMSKYDPRLELAPRDIVARAIFSEMCKQNTDHVYLDCRHFGSGVFETKFPSIHSICKQSGIDPETDLIPIQPAQHYQCGGIHTDISGKTSISQLYAGGEVARTGLHGANRLASNSLLEAVVIATNIAEDIVSRVDQYILPETIDQLIQKDNPSPEVHLETLKKKVQETMTKGVGIIRSNKGLLEALQTVEEIENEVDHVLRSDRFYSIQTEELRNILTISRAIILAAKARTVNAGGHYNTDLLPTQQRK